MRMLTESKEPAEQLRNYIVTSTLVIEQEYGIEIPKDILLMTKRQFEAWIQVYASKILLAKNVTKGAELKKCVKEFLELKVEEQKDGLCGY